MSEDLKPELRFSLFDDCWQSKNTTKYIRFIQQTHYLEKT